MDTCLPSSSCSYQQLAQDAEVPGEGEEVCKFLQPACYDMCLEEEHTFHGLLLPLCRALWSKCAGPGPRGALQSHRQPPPRAKPSRNLGLTAAGGSTSPSWLRLWPHGYWEGILRSPSAGNRWQLVNLEQGWGRKLVLLEKQTTWALETALGGSGQDEACAEMVLSVVPGKPRLGKLMPQKTWWEQRQSAFTEVPRLRKRFWGGAGPGQRAQWPCRPAWPPAADPQ